MANRRVAKCNKPTCYIYFALFLLLNSNKIYSQAVTAFFTCPDTVCVNQTFTVNNLCVGANTYYWSFCQGNTNVTPFATNLGNIGMFNGPVFTTIAKDGTNYYAFVTNNFNSTISRLFYGSSLLNTPVVVNLGNIGGLLPGNLEDLDLEFEGGNWYGIVVGGLFGSERIVRLNFGNSLANVPTAVNMGNIGSMNYPQRLRIFYTGGNYYGFVTNRNNNTLTRFSFGNSITNIPTGINLGNLGSLNTPDAIGLINVGGLWYGYIINEGSNSITRLDFGASLLSTPTATNLGNTGALNGPRGLDVWTECNQIRGLITNRNTNDLINMNFTAGPTGPIITTSMGNLANFSFPHSIGRFRSGDTLYAFITNVNNSTMSRIYYPGCTNASIASSTLATPPPISYNTPGNYYINVTINEGQITQTNYCKQVTVISPTVIASNSGVICAGGSVTLTASGANSYTWNPGGITGGTIVVTPASSTNYTVTGVSGLCSANAITNVTVTSGYNLNATASSTALCGNSATLSASGATSYTWNPGSFFTSSVVVSPTTTTIYTVTGINGACTLTKTITILSGSSPTITVLSPGFICNGNSGTLTATGATNYTWNPGALTGSSVIVNPNVTTTYSILAAIGMCTNTAITTLTVNSVPNINIIASPTVICAGNSSTLTAAGAINYTWSPGNLHGNSIIVSPSNLTTYSVTGSNGFCFSSTSLALAVTQTPTVTASLNNGGCVGDIVTLNAIGSPANIYQWVGPNGFTSSSQTPSFTASSSLYSGNYTVTVSSNGCSSSSTVFVGITTFSPAQIIASSNTGCAPLCLSFSVQSNSSGTAIWSFGDGYQNTGITCIHCFTNSGTFNTGVVVNNPLGCNSRGNLSITVLPKPVADFNYSPIKPIIGEQTTFTDASFDSIVSWNWYFTNTAQYTSVIQNPTFLYPDAGTYPAVLVVKNSHGCTDTLIKIIEVMEEFTFYLPNSFTPNDDDLNDVFQPKGVGIDKYEMRIFDRWGEQLFYTNDFDRGWDGRFQGRGGKVCPSDVYTCKIKLTNIYGKSYEYTKHITLSK